MQITTYYDTTHGLEDRTGRHETVEISEGVRMLDIADLEDVLDRIMQTPLCPDTVQEHRVCHANRQFVGWTHDLEDVVGDYHHRHITLVLDQEARAEGLQP